MQENNIPITSQKINNGTIYNGKYKKATTAKKNSSLFIIISTLFLIHLKYKMYS